MKRSFKHFFLFSLIFFFMTLPFCFNDYLFLFCKQKLAKGVITNIEELHGDFSSQVKVYYEFEVGLHVYKSYSELGLPSFRKSGLEVGDTVESIEYCPAFPGQINRLKLYRYIHKDEIGP